ncbi:MAG TPA: hypothetical protein VGM76_06425 [Lacipirellulaceae bacterium]|jgi:hypothetical protein
MTRYLNVFVLVAVTSLIGLNARHAQASDSQKPTEKAAAVDEKTAEHDHKSAENGEGAKSSSSNTHDIELGKFNVRMHRAVPTQTNRVTFTLFAAAQPDDSKHLEQLLAHRENKVRDQVIVATRLVPVEDYDDAELTQFRRRILLRLRRTMPELMIENVYVSDFSLVVENN